MSFGTIHGSSVSVTVAVTNTQGVITMPDGYDGLHICNTNNTGDEYVSLRWGAVAQTATLGTSLTLGPGMQVVVECNDKVAHVAGIANANTSIVVFTPVKLSSS